MGSLKLLTISDILQRPRISLIARLSQNRGSFLPPAVLLPDPVGD